MNKFLTTTVAALTALSTVATALPASAQSRWRDSDRDGRPDRVERNRDRDRDGRPDQYDRHDRRDRQWSRGDERGNRHHWRDQRGRNWSYYGGNYGYNGYQGQWRVGQRYPNYNNQAYVVSDYSYYGLPAPRRGYRYYRDNNGDVVMAAIAGGVIGLIIGSAGR